MTFRGKPARGRRRAVWLAAALALVAAGAAVAWWMAAGHEAAPAVQAGPPEYYVTGSGAIGAELVRASGKQPDPELVREIERAGQLAAAGDYRGALAVLAPLATRAPVPAVYNNLGVLYAARKDYLNARASFEAALRDDPGYTPARANLARLKTDVPEDQPVSRELEPNDSPVRANTVALGAVVSAEIAGGADVDAYRFHAPPPPRDLLEVAVVNRSTTLIPTLRISDAGERVLAWKRDAAVPGASLSQVVSPAPEALYYAEFWGLNHTTGAYTIEVRARHAYDAYEPDDDLAHAAQIVPGTPVDANIMDARDTDCYQFQSTVGGPVSLTLENRSPALVPALAVYDSGRRLVGFAPEAAKAGASLAYSIRTVAGETYFIQVWGRGESSGPYILNVHGLP